MSDASRGMDIGVMRGYDQREIGHGLDDPPSGSGARQVAAADPDDDPERRDHRGATGADVLHRPGHASALLRTTGGGRAARRAGAGGGRGGVRAALAAAPLLGLPLFQEVVRELDAAHPAAAALRKVLAHLGRGRHRYRGPDKAELTSSACSRPVGGMDAGVHMRARCGDDAVLGPTPCRRAGAPPRE